MSGRDMKDGAVSTRRSLLKGGAMLAAPLAAAGASAAIAEDGRKARLRRLEDEAAIRSLHASWLRDADYGALGADVSRVAPDHEAEPEVIEVAADGLRASGRFPCTIETTAEIAEDCTLAQMAHLQGGGLIRSVEKRVVKAGFVRTGGVWAMETVALS